MNSGAQNGFLRWLDVMELTTEKAAELLGKSPRMVKYYEMGRVPPIDTRKLMTALWQGFQPQAWPATDPELA